MPPNQEYLFVPDCDHYFGWYGGTIDTYGPWFDKFHADHPEQPIGVSEYGCEALWWHNSNPDAGETKILVKAGDLTDEGIIRKVSEPNPDYILKEKGAVLNWWDITEIPGYASLNTKLAKVNEAAGLDRVQALLKPIIGEAAQPQVLTMLNSMSVLRMVNLLTGSLHIELTKEILMDLNAQLNKIAL